MFLTFFLPAYQPNGEQGEGYGGQCAGEEGWDAVELAGKTEKPSGKVEQQAEADAAEEFQAHIAMAGGLRGEGKGDERHDPGCDGVNQFAPPGDGVDLGILVVVFEVADVGGQFADGHLVGFDEQYVHQVALDGNRPGFFGCGGDFDFVFAKCAAADVFQLPTAVVV